MQNKNRIKTIMCLITLLITIDSHLARAQTEITAAEARSIAKEAYIYANPMVDNYRALYDYFVDRESPDFKAPWNQIKPIPRVYTHEDRAVQTPNSDTPYALLGLDLRTEPMVLTVPEIGDGRYFSIQLTDLYTHNFDYIGSRMTGNDGGIFLIVGPGWQGEAPDGIDRLIRSETELMLAIYRTQLFNPDDLEAVKAIQAGYKAQPLSVFLGQPAPAAAPVIDFIEPLTREEITKSPKIFQQVNWILQFCPTHPSEKELMARFARLGIGAGKTFNWDAFPPEIQAAIGQGIADAWDDFAALRERINAGEVGSADAFGTREHLENNYLFRMAGAVLGIWGTSAEECVFPSYSVDSDGQPLDGAYKYTLRFEPGQLPPARAFWSLTMYELPESLLVANPIDRYLLNSPMLDDFVRDDDGGITLYLQHESPGKELEPNWLPTPAGPFYTVMRIYWPKAEALDGTWNMPKLKKADQ